MISFYNFLTKVTPLEIFPYTLIALFVIVYYSYQKYVTWIAIRNVPHSTIFEEDLDKVKKNLKVKSMVYTFILILSVLEFVANISIEGTLMSRYDFHNTATNSVNVSNFCVIRDPDLLRHLDNSTLLANITFHLTIVIISLFGPIISLFFIILRRIYLNHPFKQYVRNFTIYIVLRFLMMTILYCSIQTFYLAQMLLLPFGIIDFYIYLSSVRKLHILLKGFRDEARWHSTQQDYLIKKRSVTQFFYAQVLTVVVVVLFLSHCFLELIEAPVRIFAYNPCFLSYISFGYIPIFEIRTQIQLFASILNNYCFIIGFVIGSIFEVIMILTQLAIFLAILIKLVNRRRKFNHINDWITRPLMERYKATLDAHGRNYQQRPPFIIYARSPSC